MSKKYKKEKLEENKKAKINASDGNITTYGAMLGNSFQFKINLLSQILGSVHYPSIGTFKENLLKNVIADYLPSRYSVGTGFVMFPDLVKQENAPHRHQVSNQLDLIVYDSANYPVIFKDGDFVIVRPEAVRSIIEVKGSLDLGEIKSALDNFIDYGRKWKECKKREKLDKDYPKLPSPLMFLMAWGVSVNNKGYPNTDGERLRKEIVKQFRKLDKAEIQGLPRLNTAYIYDDCIVRALFMSESRQYGYHTDKGKLTQFNSQGEAEIAGDKTIIDLLNRIQISLETPFNEVLTSVDQTNRIDVLRHEFEGFECWLKGDDLSLVLPS